MLRADAGRAVGGNGVIPAGFVSQSIERLNVLQKAFARLRWRNRRAVKIDVFVAVICAQADDVALISDNVDKFELTVEPSNGRVGLPKLLAYLDGKAERRCVSELKADDRMRDPGRAPVIDGEVDTSDLRDAYGAHLPMRCVVGLGAVVTVAHVTKRYFVAVNVSPCFLGYVWLPVAVIGRREHQPPHEHAGKKHDKD